MFSNQLYFETRGPRYREWKREKKGTKQKFYNYTKCSSYAHTPPNILSSEPSFIISLSTVIN